MSDTVAINKGSKILHIDDVLDLVGGFGKFQKIIALLFCLSIVPWGFAILISYFGQHSPPWMCSSNSSVCNFTGEISSSNPKYIYSYRCSLERKEWKFTEPKHYSIVTQFDLHCDTEVYSYIATSLFFINWGIGAVILGWIADRYGRIKVLFPSQAAIIIFGFLSAFSPNIGVYCATRAIIGFFIPGAGIQLMVLASEFVGPRSRPFLGNCIWLFFTLGLIILGAKAYFIREWKILTIVCTVPYALFLVFFKFIPESIRWLRLNGQTEKAMSILEKMARVNKQELPDNVKIDLPFENTAKHKYSPRDIFRTKKMTANTLIQGYLWMVVGMVYYGITLASDDLGGSMYRDYILASMVEFPAYVAASYLCNRIGRKKTVSIPLFIASIACILVSLIPSPSAHNHWMVLRVVFGMIGKFCITVSFGAIYVWSAELYPTAVRAQGMGFLQVTCRIGSALAPWISKWLKVFHIVLPFSVMGGSSLIASILIQWLPETVDKCTAETLESEDEPSCVAILNSDDTSEMLEQQKEDKFDNSSC